MNSVVISVVSSLSVFLLHCSDCDFRTQIADQMAYHLLMNPEHYSATCRARSKTSPHTNTQGLTTLIAEWTGSLETFSGTPV